MNLGHLIRDKRKEKNWSQADLAAHLGVCHQFIYNIEKGIVALPPERSLVASKVLDIPIETMKEFYLSEFSKKLEKMIYGEK